MIDLTCLVLVAAFFGLSWKLAQIADGW